MLRQWRNPFCDKIFNYRSSNSLWYLFKNAKSSFKCVSIGKNVKSGTEVVKDTLWQGQANCVITDKSIRNVQKLILFMKLQLIAWKFYVSISSALKIYFEQFNMEKFVHDKFSEN